MTGDHMHSQYCLKISGIPGNAWFPQLTVTYTCLKKSGLSGRGLGRQIYVPVEGGWRYGYARLLIARFNLIFIRIHMQLRLLELSTIILI